MNHIMPKYIDVDLIIVLIVYLYIFCGDRGAGFFAFGQGVFMDLFSGGLMGLFTLVYLIIFMSVKLGSRLLDLLSTGAQISIISLAVLLKGILVILFLYILSLRLSFSGSDFLMSFSSAIFSGLIAPFLFYIFNYLNRLMSERE